MLTGGGDGGRRSESKRTMDDGSLQVGVFTGGGDLSASSDGKRCRACGSASCTSKRWRRLGWAGSSYRARPGDCAPEQRDEERWGLNGDDLQTCTGTAKPNDIDEANATVCSLRRGSNDGDGRAGRSWGRRQSRCQIRVSDPITA
jgi:hypothetical protein